MWVAKMCLNSREIEVFIQIRCLIMPIQSHHRDPGLITMVPPHRKCDNYINDIMTFISLAWQFPKIPSASHYPMPVNCG